MTTRSQRNQRGSSRRSRRTGSGGKAAMLAHPVVEAILPIVEAAGATLITPGKHDDTDVPLVWEGEMIAAVRVPPLHGALDRMIESVEAELGDKLPMLSREGKQRAIRMLDDRGAFILRRAVDDIADAMGVSRITVYNYLNAIHQ